MILRIAASIWCFCEIRTLNEKTRALLQIYYTCEIFDLTVFTIPFIVIFPFAKSNPVRIIGHVGNNQVEKIVKLK